MPIQNPRNSSIIVVCELDGTIRNNDDDIVEEKVEEKDNDDDDADEDLCWHSPLPARRTTMFM